MKPNGRDDNDGTGRSPKARRRIAPTRHALTDGTNAASAYGNATCYGLLLAAARFGAKKQRSAPPCGGALRA
ncbi:TPA: hypothetical protein ACRNI3_003416, partial [Pseudomonas aeruginosa]